MKILLVDDDPAILTMMSKTLAHRGHEVSICNSGFGVSAAILRERPEVVLLDVMMPGLGGPALVPLIAHLPIESHPKLVLWSAMEEVELRKLATRLALPHIHKSQRPSQIAELIERYARRS